MSKPRNNKNPVNSGSIASRLALMFALAVVVMGALSVLLLRASLHETLQKQMHNELQFRNTLMEPWVVSRSTPSGWQALSAKLSSLALSERGRVEYWVLSDDVRFNMGGSAPVGVDWNTVPDGFSRVAGATRDSCYLYMLVTEIPAAGEHPALKYVVAIDSTPYIGTLNEFTRSLVLITVLGAMIIALVSFAISRFCMRPVMHLSKQAHDLAPGDHQQRLATCALPQELQTLAIAFNGVLKRQEIAWRQLESFNADVAHELRTH